MNKKVFNEKAMGIIGLFTKDINNSYYGRDLARKLKSNQRTVQLTLNALEQERILQSKTKGKLKEFFLNKANMLTKSMLIAAEIYKFNKFASSNFEVYQIVADIMKLTDAPFLVFGSFAKGYATKESDLDVLIVGKVPKGKTLGLQEKYSREIHFMELSQIQFLKGLKNKEKFMLEILESHIICQGFEEFTNWRHKYGPA
ncbi:MAG: nucleotidyltransferase domain-containing protein [Candidatus Nanoarchaeia archaeon]|nr:nucleotidyltransferase domain-containing protein [Candidatus Nanoarchaeia archaeon]MDD5239633.1 nucleotidyltransferase domain-containing protein [Candidatus Nanoarchaeia archaeon]